MYFEPDSYVRLIRNCPITNKNEEIIFNNLIEQEIYFTTGTQGFEFSNVQPIKDRQFAIRVPGNSSMYYDVNYMWYRNTHFTNKMFFAFVLAADYVAPNLTEITFEIDDIQTWFMGNKAGLSSVFVEREHSPTDRYGENLVPEGLETGEYVCAKKHDILDTKGDRIYFASTFDLVTMQAIGQWPSGDLSFSCEYISEARKMNSGLVTGVYVYMLLKEGDVITVDGTRYTVTKEVEDAGLKVIAAIIKSGKSEAILNMWVGADIEVGSNPIGAKSKIPYEWLYSDNENMPIFGDTYLSGVAILADKFDGKANRTLSDAIPVFEGYYPKNMKLFTYPYNFMTISDNDSNNMDVEYEYITDGVNSYVESENIEDGKIYKIPFFNLEYQLLQSFQFPPTVKMLIGSYKGLKMNPANNNPGMFLKNIDTTNYPICSWPTGVWDQWITRNRAKIVANAFSGIVNMAPAAAGMIGTSTPESTSVTVKETSKTKYGSTGKITTPAQTKTNKYITQEGAESIAGAGVNLITGTFGTMATMAEHSHIPESASGTVGGSNVAFDHGYQYMSIYFMTIRAEYAKKIDQFLTRYGYKLQQFKKPELACRENWTYTETRGCHFSGKCPADAARRIEALFDGGITFWRYKPDMDFANYELDNPILAQQNGG